MEIKIILASIYFAGALANVYPPLKSWKYRDRDWWKDNLTISVFAFLYCFMSGVFALL